MARCDLREEFARVDEMVRLIERFVPDDAPASIGFRAELAGFLVVAMASSYENNVKQVLVAHAAKKHTDFERFAVNNFDRLNSRVRIGDLEKYARLFDVDIERQFKSNLKEQKRVILDRTGHSIEARYHQILDWRHSYAHSGKKNTTIREAIEFHVYAKRVLFCFSQAFDAF